MSDLPPPPPLSTRSSLTVTNANELHDDTSIINVEEVTANRQLSEADSDVKPVKVNVPEPEKEPSKEVTWDGPDDPENPYNWPMRRKVVALLVCCFMTLNATFASSAPSTAIEQISLEFGSSTILTTALTSVFLVGYTFGPMLWGPGSELRGRREIFIVSMTCHTLLHLGQALGQNIQTLLATRFIAGIFAVAPLVVAGGVVADVFGPLHRGPATTYFVLCVFLGPAIGPIVSSFIVTSYLGWRWVFWVMMIFSGTATVLVIFFLPETYGPVLLQRKAIRLRREEPEKNADVYAPHEKQDFSFKGIMIRTLLRPFIMLSKEVILLLITIYMSLIYGILYALFEAYPVIFLITRKMAPQYVGLMFIGVGIGTTCGSLANLYFSKIYAERSKEWKGHVPPEYRLWGAMWGGPTFVIGAMWIGWSGNYEFIPWYVPALAGIPIGASVSLIFISLTSYLVDTYMMYSASALAANVMVRSLVAAAFPLFISQFMLSLGIGWSCTIISAVILVLAPSPFLFFKYGPKIRASSTFSPSKDLEIAKEIKAEKQAAAKQASIA